MISEVALTREEERILSKGLSFVPGPPDHQTKARHINKTCDLLEKLMNEKFEQAFQQDMDGRPYQSRRREQAQTTQKYMRAPRLPSAPARKLPGLQGKIQKMEENLLAIEPKHYRPNLKKKERVRMRNLKQRTDIVVTDADKGSEIVVFKAENYRKAGLKHVDNSATYQKLEYPEQTFKEIKSISSNLILRLYNNGGQKGFMNVALRDSLLAFQSKIPSMYFLPKTHKPLDEELGTFKTRPVLSGCAAPTRPVDKMMTAVLMPLLKLLPDRLKDTTHFLQVLEEVKTRVGKAADNLWLVSLDIESLYPSIPQIEAAETVAEFYEDNLEEIRTDLALLGIRTPPSRALVKDSLLHIMEDTILKFDNKVYRQKTGTAIGASVSVAVAEIFVHCKLELGRLETAPNLVLYKRYIDDIFCLLEGDESTILNLVDWANIAHPSLKFTHEFHKVSLPFLDTVVYLNADRTIHSRTYYKPGNAHQYLHWTSSHPRSLKQSLPYSLALRIKRICSEDIEYQKSLQEMWEFFRQRGYPTSALTAAEEKLEKLDRLELLGPRSRPEDDRCILTAVFDESWAAELKDELHQLWTWVQTEFEQASWVKYFPRQPPMLAWERNNSLKDDLMRAEFPKVDKNAVQDVSPGGMRRKPT